MKRNTIILLILAITLGSWTTTTKDSKLSGACLLHVYNNLSITVDDVYVDTDVVYADFPNMAANTYGVTELSWQEDALEVDVQINNAPKNLSGNIRIYDSYTLVTTIPISSSVHNYAYIHNNPGSFIQVSIDPY